MLRAPAARDEAPPGWVRSRWSTPRAASAPSHGLLLHPLDENAASHIALGHAYTFALDDDADHPRANHSSIHIDFMIGSPEMEVDGITGGDRVPLLRGGAWQV